MNIVIFGAPGSGKGTQSDLLIDRLDLFHISTGELLRDHIARKTPLGITADSFISKGNLIPDDLMLDILANHIDEHPEAKGRLLLDGFPRTLEQARQLTRLLADRDMQLDAVVGLEADDDILIPRLLQRGKETGRADDNIDTIRRRMEVYHSQSQPLRDHYLDGGIYHSINAVGDVKDIHNRIIQSLDSHTNATKA